MNSTAIAQRIEQNRVHFLEREVAHLRTLVAAHNQTLVEAHRILQLAASLLPSTGPQQQQQQQQGPSGEHFRRLAVDLANVQRRIPRILDAQAKAFESPGAQRGGNENAEENGGDDGRPQLDRVPPSPAFFQHDQQQQQQQQPQPQAALTSAAADAALLDRVRADILSTCSGAFHSWCRDAREAYAEILGRPAAAMDIFRDEPSEDALEGFLEAFDNARSLLLRTVERGSDVFTSPFSSEAIDDALRATLQRHFAAEGGAASSNGSANNAKTGPKKPEQGAFSNGMQMPQRSSSSSSFAGVPMTSGSGLQLLQGVSSSSFDRGAMNPPSNRSSAVGDDNDNDYYDGGDNFERDGGFANTAPPPPLSAVSIQSSRASTGAPALALTPSRYRPDKNASGQFSSTMSSSTDDANGFVGAMRGRRSAPVGSHASALQQQMMLAAGANGQQQQRPVSQRSSSAAIGSGASESAVHSRLREQQPQQQQRSPSLPAGRPTASAPSAQQQQPPSGRLQLLQWQLQQLEMQLFAQTQGGARASGSEAKFYAINKKLARIRAEILREQRAEQEVAQVQTEVASVRKAREMDRANFGR